MYFLINFISNISSAGFSLILIHPRCYGDIPDLTVTRLPWVPRILYVETPRGYIFAICLSVCPCSCVSVFVCALGPSVRVSVYLSVCPCFPCVLLSDCSFIRAPLAVCPLSLSVRVSVCPYLSMCPVVHVPECLSVRLSVCLFVRICPFPCSYRVLLSMFPCQ